MKLHLFNPEHDMALAYNDPYFTAPHAGRQMRADLGFLPALWADDGDMVWVDDVEAALERVRHFKKYAADVVFVADCDLRRIFQEQDPVLVSGGSPSLEIAPWGWDSALRQQLKRLGVSELYLPKKELIADVREISSRRFSSAVLADLMMLDDAYVGESRYVETLDEVEKLLTCWRHIVVKAPWSCSGRGIRYVKDEIPVAVGNWMTNVMRQQGGVMVEPYYNKVIDFGMEFMAHDDAVDYVGLSLFETINGAYAGSVLASEDDKRRMLTRHLSPMMTNQLIERLKSVIARHLGGRYQGPLGVDLMLVMSGDALRVHPCVEINLRRTMGHVAIALTPALPGARELMRITWEGARYHLRIQPMNNYLKTEIL